MIRFWTPRSLGAILGAAILTGCAAPHASPFDESSLEAIPPLPEGFVPLPSESTAFRAARIETPGGTWRVNFDDGITKIETSPYVVPKLDGKWYPEEGGAHAALCRGYQRGNEIMVRLEGSSDVVTEETRIIFENRKLREVVKYSIPGAGLGPGLRPKVVPYSERVKRQVF